MGLLPPAGPGGFEIEPQPLGIGKYFRGLTSLFRPNIEIDTAEEMPYPAVRVGRITPHHLLPPGAGGEIITAPGGAPIPEVRGDYVS